MRFNLGSRLATAARRVLASRYRLAVLIAAVAASLFLLTRLCLLAVHRAPTADGIGLTLLALAVGEGYDAVVALWLVLPLGLYLSLLPERWYRTRWQQGLLWLWAGAAIFGLFFVAAAEWFFFEELQSRLNFVAVDYLLYPQEVMTNIWESYPTGWILAGLTAITLVILARFRRLAPSPAPTSGRRRAQVAAALVLCTGLGTWEISPGWADLSNDRVLDDLARNGLYTFFAAFRGSHASYEGLYATLPEPEVFARLHALLAEPATQPASFAPRSTARRLSNPGPERRLNVVVVLEESLGAELVGVLGRGDDLALTPHLDALSAEGTLLAHAYSTGNRTIRAIEATTSGLPPLPGISVVRRPQTSELFTLPALLREQGYQTSFVYGGRAIFDGMGGYLNRNGVERIIDLGDFPDQVFTTAWGAADGAIFDRALVEMDTLAASGRPFYTLVLTVSNHRPFRFPEDQVQRDPGRDGRRNAVRYADWALGHFFAEAKQRPWYGQTLFVVMGDHGARVYGAAEIPLASYEVPILLIGPGVPAGERIDTLASSLDVPPTVLGVLGLDYASKFFGRDVFHLPHDQGRALMTHNSDVAMLEGDRLVVLGIGGSTKISECDLVRVACRPIVVPQTADRELISDAIAYYAGANQLYSTGGYRLPQAPPAAAQEELAASREPAHPWGG